jgi:hypothetical protein
MIIVFIEITEYKNEIIISGIKKVMFCKFKRSKITGIVTEEISAQA